MLFHSWQFFLFFLLVLVVYWQLDHHRQNRWLLLASYVFYGWWDWRFLSLIWISTLTDYIAARKIGFSTERRHQKLWLMFSLIINFALLGVFKYFNFFSQSVASLVNSLGGQVEPHLLQLILPVGISFYTFQTVSYTVDVYRQKLQPSLVFSDFALFVAFFPQLIAGPIERADRLIPQIIKPRRLSSTTINNGLWLFFYGLWLKVFVADGLAPLVERIFDQSTHLAGATTVIGAWAFAWQIFADFAGYSSMACGLAYLLGFNLMINFKLPFWAQNASEFWQRWHISLSNWVRDYIYIPLGGSRLGRWRTYQNLFVTMVLMGLWHGANNTFLIWGLYWGCVSVLYHWYRDSALRKIIIDRLSFVSDRAWWYGNAILLFNVFAFSMIFFRADNLQQAWNLIGTLPHIHFPLTQSDLADFTKLAARTILLIIMSAYLYLKNDQLAIKKLPNLVKAPLIAGMVYGILLYGGGGEVFIYFAF